MVGHQLAAELERILADRMSNSGVFHRKDFGFAGGTPRRTTASLIELGEWWRWPNVFLRIEREDGDGAGDGAARPAARIVQHSRNSSTLRVNTGEGAAPRAPKGSKAHGVGGPRTEGAVGNADGS